MTGQSPIHITPYLSIKGADQAIEFYQKAFGAIQAQRMTDGPRVSHAELKIGEAVLYLADEHPELNFFSPVTLGKSPVLLVLQVPDVDTLFAQAVAAGATEITPVKNQFYGERSGQIADPFGYHWWISTKIEDVSNEELQRRAAAESGSKH